MNKPIIWCFIIVFMMTVSKASIDSCSTHKSNAIFALLDSQKHVVPLGDYIKGYNLHFQASKPNIVYTYDPVNFIASSTSGFQQGYNIINADVLETQDKQWFKEGMILAQKDEKNIGISTALFSGAKQLRTNITFSYYTLPMAANCFSGQVVDRDFNVAIDCQSMDGDTDIICKINTQDQQMQCIEIDSLSQVHERKSEILYVGKNEFLITSTYSYDQNTSDLTYLTIYSITEGRIDFVNIIDSYQLGLDKDIVISDFDITKNGQIVLNDIISSTIYFVSYELPNTISVKKKWNHNTDAYEIEVSNTDTILLADHIAVNQFDLGSLQNVGGFELEKSDNNVVNIEVNDYAVAVQTQIGFLYIYERNTKSINFLLAKKDIKGKDYFAAPYANVLYLFEADRIQIWQVSSGFMKIQNLGQNTNFTITATSTVSNCSFDVQIIKLDNTDKIVVKQNISSKHFKTEPAKKFSLDLEEIYGGSNLKYSTPESTDKIHYTLEHMNQFKINSTVQDPVILSQVVVIDTQSFYLLSLTKDTKYLETCTINQDKITVGCVLIHNSTYLVKDSPLMVAGRMRKNGHAVFSMTFSEGRVSILKVIDGKAWPTFIFTGSTFDYSSIVIGQDRIYYVMKKFANIQIYFDYLQRNQFFYINKQNFVPEDINQKGFYPRDLYLHPSNDNLFFIKFPTSFCMMGIVNGVPLTIECAKTLDNVIPQENWELVIGSSSFVVFTPQKVTEYSIITSIPAVLHEIDVGSGFTAPIQYVKSTNTIIFKDKDGKILYYKLNKPVIDSVYYQTASQLNEVQTFSNSQMWTLLPSTQTVYRQSNKTAMTIDANLNDDQFKQDFKFSIKVQSESGQEIESNSDVIVINYPVKIKQIKTSNDAIDFPETASKVKIPINLQSHFTGSIADYKLTCAYCNEGNEITLQTNFKNLIDNPQLVGAHDMLQISADSILILSNNRINLVNKQNKIQNYKVIEGVKSCYKLGWLQSQGALIFCQNTDGQQILLYHVSIDQIFLKTKYVLHEQSTIKNVNEILVSKIDNSSAFVMISDNDVTFDSVSKTSNIKAFILTDDAMQFKGVLTSKSFGAASIQPINDMDIENGHIMVTIGNIGVGFAKLSVDGIVSSPQTIDFNSIDELEKYTLDDSFYQQVQIMSFNTELNKVKIFVTSTTSLHMVLNFGIKEETLTLVNVAELYNRYGLLSALNWQFITEKYLLLAYYNENTFEENVVFYQRSEKGLVNFVSSYRINIPKNMLLEHALYLTSDNIFFASDIGTPSVDAKVSRYEISSGFNFIANYDKPAVFKSITVTASNAYDKADTVVNVTFAGDQGGLQWYTVVIISFLVFLVVGVAYGMYLKMIKNRKEKKVSLLTQGQADEEV